MDEAELLKLELARERRARQQAESLLERKSLELYLRNEELQKRTAALAQSNAELEQFAMVASHDLQAPLRTISGFSELLAEQCGPQMGAEATEYISYIRSGAGKLQTLIHDLLDYAKVGRSDCVKQWFSLQALMLEVQSALHDRLSRCGGTLRFTNLPEICADRLQIGRVLQNLVDNALKFQQPGQTPLVEIEADIGAEQWTLRVRDNGIGIPAQHQQTIFGVFARLHGEDVYPGSGVGLPICMRIVERHGGRLWLESESGHGSCFHFTLPKPTV